MARGVQLLGQIKNGSCRPRAILFKVLADTVGLESKLMVVCILEFERIRKCYFSFQLFLVNLLYVPIFLVGIAQ